MSQSIPFNIPPILGTELEYVRQALSNKKLSGDGPFNKKASALLAQKLGAPYVNLTPSCTAALEMAYLIIDLKPGDEVIMPSFTFTSTATAVTLFGATPVFVDIDETFNIDISKIESAITDKTKAICVVHYAGTSCDLDQLQNLLKSFDRKIYLIEDAAQAIDAFYKGKPLGTFGDISAFSFHETKNVVCGEGGAIVINNVDLTTRAEVIRDKGTNRQSFLRGEVDKYTWQDKGSSYLLGEIPAAFLLAQLEGSNVILEKRLALWNRYNSNLISSNISRLLIPNVPPHAQHNGHIYYFLLPSETLRNDLASYLKTRDITAVTHYVPLHSSPAGRVFGKYAADLERTGNLASRLLRLPIYYDLKISDVDAICTEIESFLL